MDTAILVAVGISHLVTSMLLIRAMQKIQRLEAANRKLRGFVNRLITVNTPPKRSNS